MTLTSPRAVLTGRVPIRLPQTPRGSGALVFGSAVVLLMAVVALLAPVVSPYDPFVLSTESLRSPSAAHWLGTDALGRDVLSGLIWGARVSLLVSFAAGLTATSLGLVLGSLAGFKGGLLDVIVMRIAEIFQIFPILILAALIVVLAGPNMLNVIVVIGMLSWPQAARLARNEAMRVRSLDYVEAARCLGRSGWYLLAREIIPNIAAPVVALGALIVAQAIILESSLSFLGLGPQGVASWGWMLQEGMRRISDGWWLSVFPGGAIFLTVLAFNVLGDALSKEKKR